MVRLHRAKTVPAFGEVPGLLANYFSPLGVSLRFPLLTAQCLLLTAHSAPLTAPLTLS